MKQHEYMRRLNLAIEQGIIGGPKGGVTEMTVGHDDGCRIDHNGFCNCNPSITFMTDKGLCSLTKDGLVQAVDVVPFTFP